MAFIDHFTKELLNKRIAAGIYRSAYTECTAGDQRQSAQQLREHLFASVTSSLIGKKQPDVPREAMAGRGFDMAHDVTSNAKWNNKSARYVNS